MMSSSDSHCHGLASSNNSLSHYGSEVGLDLYDRAEHLKASLSENLINNMMREEDFEGSNESINDQLILNPPVLKTTSDRQNSKCSSGKSRYTFYLHKCQFNHQLVNKNNSPQYPRIISTGHRTYMPIELLSLH